jgi:PAP2 superfamily
MKSCAKLPGNRLLLLATIIILASCEKIDWRSHDGKKDPSKKTKTYSSEIVQAWINFDLRLLRTNPAILNNFIMVQHWAYSSIALYEALLPGMPAYQTLAGQLDQMPVMPAADPGMTYHWPTCANTVFAAMTRNYYPNLPAADKTSTDSLEAAFNARYKGEVDAAVFQRSVDFGKAVAQRVYDWSKTDGSLKVNPPYVIPVGPGFWEKTPPGLLDPQNPYWANNRPLMAGSVEASQIPAPVGYSTDPSSHFFDIVREVYELSLVLTDDQKEQVIFWRDVPGGGHAHWLAIFSQVLNKEGNTAMLDKAALVYAKMGITQSDARISCWKAKYTYNLLRPITYIRAVMGHSSWNSFITTPNHPEYPSAHSSFSAPAADILTLEFGDKYTFTDHTYDFLGLPARAYSSFNHAAKDAGDSRVFGGLHYRISVTAGNQLGSAVAKYLNDKIKFKKR